MSDQQPIILSETGGPFLNENDAKHEMKRRELPREKYATIKYQGGWAIADIGAIAKAAAPAVEDPPPPGTKQREYWLVELSHKSSPNDLNMVPITIPSIGLEIRVARGVPTVLPDCALEVLDHASHEQWQPSGDPRVPVQSAGRIHRFPYRKIRKATEQEFRDSLASGTQIQNDAIAKLRRANQ